MTDIQYEVREFMESLYKTTPSDDEVYDAVNWINTYYDGDIGSWKKYQTELYKQECKFDQ